MGRELDCLRCGNLMKYMKSEKIQLGQYGWLLGDISNLMAGSLDVDIYACDACGKLEFYNAEESKMEEDQIAQIRCPNCGKVHDIDYPRCPICKNDYHNE